jgi:acyl dehydratase
LTRFPIEAAHVLMFLRAGGDAERADAALASADGAALAALPVPPTFAIAEAHFDPAYERRPRPGVAWFGSGREPISASDAPQQPRGEGGGFHAEQHFSYHRTPRVGDVLFGTECPGRRWEKQGRRGGALRFTERITEYRDAAGAPVVTLRAVDVATARRVGVEAPGAEAPPEPPARAEAAPLRVHEEVVVEDLRRTQIAMYAGASGDFHPMHSDETYAKAMGMPGVFAHGMLTMGLAGRALVRAAGDGALLDYGARFLRPVWPGDTLVARVALAALERDGARRVARYALAVRNERGECVLEGEARALPGGAD